MSDPSEPLHRAIRDALVASPAVTGAVGARIFDFVPTNVAPAMPYISFGAFQVLDDSAACIDGAEVFVILDIWSRDQRTIEAKRLCALVAEALHEAELDLGPMHRLVEIMHQSTRVFIDADGVTTHGVVTFRALTEAAI